MDEVKEQDNKLKRKREDNDEEDKREYYHKIIKDNLLWQLCPKLFGQIDQDNKENKQSIIPIQYSITCGSRRQVHFICDNRITDENDEVRICNKKWYSRIYNMVTDGANTCPPCGDKKGILKVLNNKREKLNAVTNNNEITREI